MIVQIEAAKHIEIHKASGKIKYLKGSKLEFILTSHSSSYPSCPNTLEIGTAHLLFRNL